MEPGRGTVLWIFALLVTCAAALATAGTAAQEGTPNAWPAGSPAGGATVEVVLEPRPARGTVADADARDRVRATLERRLELLGVETETLLPVLSEVGLLEIVDPQGQYLELGTLVTTTLGPPPEGPRGGPVYETIVDGDDLEDAFVVPDQTGEGEVVGFRLEGSAAETFGAFTTKNIGQPMSILVDKRVVSTATIQAPIYDEGIITGVPPEEVRGLVVRLGSGPLPMPLAVVGVDGAPLAATPGP
jgi:preprotein translocase subunit SecD